MKEKRYEVWEGNILRASSKTFSGAQMFMKPGRIIKENMIGVNVWPNKNTKRTRY